jgi:hypothetical protein
MRSGRLGKTSHRSSKMSFAIAPIRQELLYGILIS